MTGHHDHATPVDPGLALLAEAGAELSRPLPEPDGARTTARRATVRLSQVTEEKVSWLADGLIPWGALTQLVGSGGQGKTTFALHVAARLTRGQPTFPWMRAPDPADVLIVSTEDAISYVLKPRLRIAGADMDRVHAWDFNAADLVLPDGLELLEQEVEDAGARLVIIDPLSALLSSSTDSHKDASLRGVLRPLHTMAERRRLATIGILHLNQSTGGDVATRVSGSGAWVNAARSALVFGPPPDAEEGDPRRIVAVAKNNYAPVGVSHEVELRVPAGEDHPAVVYVGTSPVKSGDVLAGPSAPEDRTAAADCRDWLAGVLTAGPRNASELQNAGKSAGFTDKNLRMAAQRLRVVKRKAGFSGGWVWSLPDDHEPKMPSAEGVLTTTTGGAPSHEPRSQAVLGGLDAPETPEDALSLTPHAREAPSGPTRTGCARCGTTWPGPGTVCDPCLEDHR